MRPAPPRDEVVVWHDVECGAYAADLPLWRELAAEAGGPVLELGAGTGRVSLDLATRGHEVWGLECEPALARALRRRARQRGVRVCVHAGDARAFELHRRFALVIAPMQVVQLLGGSAGRRSMLAAIRRHLSRAGTFAAALADPLEGLPAEGALPPLPDVGEVGGWVYSSRPVSVREENGEIVVERVRELVSPNGELATSAAALRLERVDAEELGNEGQAAGFRALERRTVPATGAYVGSAVALMEAV
jgi:hypothetical protein